MKYHLSREDGGCGRKANPHYVLHPAEFTGLPEAQRCAVCNRLWSAAEAWAVQRVVDTRRQLAYAERMQMTGNIPILREALRRAERHLIDTAIRHHSND